jgi:hypothetical protein
MHESLYLLWTLRNLKKKKSVDVEPIYNPSIQKAEAGVF